MGQHGNPGRPKTRGQCRLCGRSQPVGWKEWYHAADPRCVACGGKLDYKGHWKGNVHVASALSASDIRYPAGPTEFEVQAFLLIELRRLGLHVRGCVPAHGSGDVFDLVIYDADLKPVRIVEVKKQWGKPQKRQIRRYERYGVPVDVICGMGSAEKYVHEVAAGRKGLPVVDESVVTAWGVIG